MNPIKFYYTPIVDGVSMDRYLDDPGAHAGTVSVEAVLEETERLKDAVRWLFSKGFIHGDIQLSVKLRDPSREPLRP